MDKTFLGYNLSHLLMIYPAVSFCLLLSLWNMSVCAIDPHSYRKLFRQKMINFTFLIGHVPSVYIPLTLVQAHKCTYRLTYSSSPVSCSWHLIMIISPLSPPLVSYISSLCPSTGSIFILLLLAHLGSLRFVAKLTLLKRFNCFTMEPPNASVHREGVPNPSPGLHSTKSPEAVINIRSMSWIPPFLVTSVCRQEII